MYVSVQDMRDEGVTEKRASDARLQAAIEEASQTIDGFTGRFFEARPLRLRFSGRQTSTLASAVPLIQVNEMAINGQRLREDVSRLLLPTAPVLAGQFPEDLVLQDGRIFPAGCLNIEIEGLWGYTELDGSAHGRTPLDIKRVCKMLVLHNIPKLADDDAVGEAIHRWRIVEERTRDQSYKLAPIAAGRLTGDATIDNVLLRYRRPPQMGAA